MTGRSRAEGRLPVEAKIDSGHVFGIDALCHHRIYAGPYRLNDRGDRLVKVKGAKLAVVETSGTPGSVRVVLASRRKFKEKRTGS